MEGPLRLTYCWLIPAQRTLRTNWFESIHVDWRNNTCQFCSHLHCIARFGINARLSMILNSSKKIIKRSAKILDAPIDDDAAFEIAQKSGNAPHCQCFIKKNTRLRARKIKGDGKITKAIAQMAFKALDVDEMGWTIWTMGILLAIIRKIQGEAGYPPLQSPQP